MNFGGFDGHAATATGIVALDPAEEQYIAFRRKGDSKDPSGEPRNALAVRP